MYLLEYFKLATPLFHHAHHRGFGGEGFDLIQFHPTQIMRFIANGIIQATVGAEDVADIVVKMCRLAFTFGDEMDIDIEDTVTDVSKIC